METASIAMAVPARAMSVERGTSSWAASATARISATVSTGCIGELAALSSVRHDDGGGERRRVRERHVPAGHAESSRPRGRPSRDGEQRRPVPGGEHLDVGEVDAAEAGGERLHGGLLGGET